MKRCFALRWYGNQDVQVEEVPVPAITEPKDVICKVMGTTVCGSDLYLYHKEIMQMQTWVRSLVMNGRALSRRLGVRSRRLKKGNRSVASFQIAYVFLHPELVALSQDAGC